MCEGSEVFNRMSPFHWQVMTSGKGLKTLPTVWIHNSEPDLGMCAPCMVPRTFQNLSSVPTQWPVSLTVNWDKKYEDRAHFTAKESVPEAFNRTHLG